MSIWLAIFLVIFGLTSLWKGADWLVSGASTIAKNLGVPAIVIGLTIVAFGTSLPELLVSLLAAIRGNSAIAFGNVLGSNIANVFLILGLSLLMTNLPIKKNTLKIEVLLALAAAVMMLIFSPDGVLSTLDGLALMFGFIIFFTYTIFSVYKGKKSQDNDEKTVKKINLEKDLLEKRNFANKSFLKSGFLIISGLLALAVGGNWTVDGASAIAQAFGLSQALIGLTIVAIGTSLPELVTVIVGTIKGETDLVIGNIIGSNIFNTWWILGLSALINNIKIEGNFSIDLWLNAIAFVLVFAFAFWGKPKYALKKWQGLIFLAIYIAYIWFLIIRG